MRSFAVSMALFLGGCSGLKAHQKAYIAGAVTKQVATEAHGMYSEELNSRVDGCDPEKNAQITTKSAFDDCMGPFANNEDVVFALQIYQKAAESLFIYLKTDAPEKDKIKDLRDSVIDAAFLLLEKIPGGDEYIGQIESVLGGK